MSSLTITVDGTISVVGTATVTSTPQAAVVSDSKSNNMAPIIGGVLGALAVAALVILFLFFRSRRVRRVRLETDKGARSQFLRLEDYPLHSARRSLPRSDTRPPSAQYTSSSKTRAEPGALSTTSLLPQTPTTSAQTSPSEAHDATDAAPEQPQPEVEPPARINAQPSRDSGYRVLEERLATLEAQVADQQQPPPYVQED
ncbi:hypothetical protein DFH07DRAFT_857672 [Mycena maculata]|uniref:Transmembrane protein n=1 Tax=Mycena maculata TaxID=230809 RepID=A0AAD7HIJ9_9AGAR|nr:hypothetical protein DFH07DRAFT_857672 [Mycena maculata]